MKMESSIIRVIKRIDKLAIEMGGVFSSSDISNLIGGGDSLFNSRVKRRLVENGVITRVQKGIYVTKECDLWMLAARISPNSYISLDSVLAKNGLIGSVPKRYVSAVHSARNRKISFAGGIIQFHSIRKGLIFGIEKLSNGVVVASTEKAFIDLLYYYSKGIRFVIDPLTEVNIKKLDVKRIDAYLDKYKNPKFVRFVKGIFNEKRGTFTTFAA